MEHRGTVETIETFYRNARPRWLLTQDDLNSYQDTVELIVDWARKFSDDVLIFRELGLSIYDLYNYSRGLKYTSDPVGLETVSRPLITLNPEWTGPRDCDDKTLQILAGCIVFGLPGRPVVVGQRKSPHHIYPEIKPSGSSIWIPADPTYTDRSIFGEKLYGEVFRKEYSAI